MIMVSGDTPSGLACWHRALTLASINDGTSSASTSSPAPPPQSPTCVSSNMRTSAIIQRNCKSAPSKSRRYPSLLEKEFGIDEITTTKELGLIASDYNALCTQALLVYERIRGASHENLVSLIMYRGAMCADAGDYRQATHLWILAYDLQLKKCDAGSLDIFHPRLCRNLKFLCRVLYHMAWQSCNDSHKLKKIKEERFSKLFEMIVNHILRAINLHTRNESESGNLDFLLTALITFFCAYLQMFSNQERSMQFWQHLRKIIQANPKDSESKALLKICLDKDRFLPYTEVPVPNLDNELPGSAKAFPWLCRPMLEILLLLGADPLVRDHYGDTVLHATVKALGGGCSDGAVDTDTVVMLLKHGAHADQVNRDKATPLDLLPASEVGVRRILQNKVSLKCLAARVIVSHNISYIEEIPRALYSFVELHAF